MKGGEKMAKKPWLAALLNVIWSGLGYLYVGKRKLFGVLLILSEILACVWLFTDPVAWQVMENIWVGLAAIPFVIGLAVDAYNDAKNKK